MEVKEINDIHITHLSALYVLNTWLSFEMAETFILKLIVTYMSICGPGQLGRYSVSLESGRSEDRIPMNPRFSTLVQTGPGAHSASPKMGTGSLYRDKAAGAWL